MSTDATSELVGFARSLRDRGVRVTTGRVLAFHRAVHAVRPLTLERLYWIGRITLVARPEDFGAFHRAFVEYFNGVDEEEALPQPPRPWPVPGEPERFETQEGAATPTDSREALGLLAGEPGAVPVVASDEELLRHRSFEELTASEQAEVDALIRRLHVTAPRRRSRRLVAAPAGPRLDLRRTLRASLASEGELLHRAWRTRRWSPRPVVLVLDVSGSMTPYARAMVQFAFAAVQTGNRVEVFSFSTRLTRVTLALRTSNPHRALTAASRWIHDWEGGTRIGQCLKELLDTYGQRAFLRGALVVICSDGLERGDPNLLATQMARLSRLTHRIIWVNPLKGSPRYRPLAAGMAAALPFVDAFMSGHNLESLEALGEVIRQ